MAKVEWLRTFVVAYQVGSVTEAARQRHISQPSATGHLRSLETAVGSALFVRRRSGVEPTDAGRRLYADVADPLDRLGAVLNGLDRGVVAPPTMPLRIGATPEIFAGLIAPRIVGLSGAVNALLGLDDALNRDLASGDADALVTASLTPRKGMSSRVVGYYHYALVSPRSLRERPSSLGALGDLLRGKDWVSYSSDLPKTRSFWKRHFGRAFDGDLRLVAPDLRVVLSAVEAGVGTSLLPTLVCAEAIERGSVVEPFDVGHLIEPRPLWLVARPEMQENALFREFEDRLVETVEAPGSGRRALR